MTTATPTVKEGLVHHRAGRLAQAEDVYRRVLSHQPDNSDALHLLGLIAFRTSRQEEALELIARAVVLKPGMAEFHSNLAMVYGALGRLDECVHVCHEAARLLPQSSTILCNLGSALQLAGRVDEAIETYKQSLSIDPRDLGTRNNLGEAYKRKSMWDDAVKVFQSLLRERPDMFEAQINLGGALQARGDLDEAIACYQRAGRLRPNAAEVDINLSGACKDAGLLDLSIEHANRSIELNPHAKTASGRLFLLHYHHDYDAKRLHDASLDWYQRFVKPSAEPSYVHQNDPSLDRRLRIGYVSGDFHDHPVGYNLLPLLGDHDHGQFEIFCYSNTFEKDALTERIKSAADHWREITGLSDEQTADLIHRDQIDILLDLSLHTGNNRLLVFGRKPAPVQVTFAGYPGTTGLPCIDYRLTDPHLDPADGTGDRFYVEQTYRLPDTFWCFDPAAAEPQVNPLPASTNGYVTFGSLCNFCKINEQVLALWAQVLKAVPRSRLQMLSKRGRHRQRVTDFLSGLGLERHRIGFFDQLTREQYLRAYHQLDIGLDTFPYNGHTTSLDSFWMGVPVVTLLGKTVVGRAGLSQSRNLKLDELIAYTPEQFVQTAVSLACDLPRLAELRSTLRRRMQKSPLMDGKRFAAGMEAAYRWMWNNWVKARSSAPKPETGTTA